MSKFYTPQSLLTDIEWGNITTDRIKRAQESVYFLSRAGRWSVMVFGIRDGRRQAIVQLPHNLTKPPQDKEIQLWLRHECNATQVQAHTIYDYARKHNVLVEPRHIFSTDDWLIRKSSGEVHINMYSTGMLKYDPLKFYTDKVELGSCLLYTSPSPRDRQKSRMPSAA